MFIEQVTTVKIGISLVVHQQMNKENMVNTNNRILFSHKEG
jgi:hypothetical protein